MRETGIIMTGESPTAILEGRKTQTRRTQGLGKINENPELWETPCHSEVAGYWDFWQPGAVLSVRCPYGQVGDRLWVRETWQNYRDWEGDQLYYRADGKESFAKGGENIKIYWKSSRFMFKKYARIWLEITDIRVERLQEITEEGAIAEGWNCYPQYRNSGVVLSHNLRTTGYGNVIPTAREWFKELWDSLNAKRGYSWETNPWVWCISFRRLK